MEKIGAVIVDDENNSIKLLDHLLEEYCPEIEVIGTSNTKKGAIHAINTLKPKILFLDISLDIGLSFDVLKEAKFKESKIIFVTAYDEYAMTAFKHETIDYILKPVAIDELVKAVNKALREVKREEQFLAEGPNHINYHEHLHPNFNFIAIPTVDRIDFIPIDTISFVKSEGRYTIFNLRDKSKIIASKSLGEFEPFFNPEIFFRVHNRYIINLNCIGQIYRHDGPYCVMQNGEKVTIAKRRVDELLKFVYLK